MKIDFIKHSSFLIETQELLLLFDYFITEPQQPIDDLLQKRLQESQALPLYIFVTHSHYDHYSEEIFYLFGGHKVGATFILHKEVEPLLPQKLEAKPHLLATGEQRRVGEIEVKAYGSTDEGGSFLVTLPDGRQLFHAGDLNNWHWNEEADQEYIDQYEAHWHQELAHLVADRPILDLLMFPTDLRLGKDYLKGLEELLEQIPVRTLAPMHINGVMTDPTPLRTLCDRHHVQLIEEPLRAL